MCIHITKEFHEGGLEVQSILVGSFKLDDLLMEYSFTSQNLGKSKKK